MRRYAGVVVGLAGITAAWSVAMAVAISQTPSLWQSVAVRGAVLMPIALTLGATLAAWRGSRLGLVAATILLAAFSFVTGFSIGNAYIPAVGVLVVASLLAALPWFRTAR